MPSRPRVRKISRSGPASSRRGRLSAHPQGRRSGSQAIAIAIMTRCRIPPDIWCGKSSKRRSGSEILTRSKRLTTAARDRPSSRPRWSWSTSATCGPTRIDGLRERHGLLEHHPDPIAANACDEASGAEARSRSPKLDAAAGDEGGRVGRSRMIDKAVRLLPEPDSPTIARISPRSRSRSRSETASKDPREVVSRTVRSRMVRRLATEVYRSTGSREKIDRAFSRKIRRRSSSVRKSKWSNA